MLLIITKYAVTSLVIVLVSELARFLLTPAPALARRRRAIAAAT